MSNPENGKEAAIVPICDFDSDAKCPKCDTKRDEEVGKEGPGVLMTWMMLSDEHGVSVNGITVELPIGFEFMKCACNRCSFQWLMQTSDAEERAEAAKKAQEEAAERAEAEQESKESPPVKFPGHTSRKVLKK